METIESIANELMKNIEIVSEAKVVTTDGIESLIVSTVAQNGVYIDEDGNAFYTCNGVIHKESGPAIMWADGTMSWRRNGRPFRSDGGPTTDGPSVRKWCGTNGVLSRVGGPALETITGYCEYWLNGELFETKDDYDNTCEKLGLKIVSQDEVTASYKEWKSSK